MRGFWPAVDGSKIRTLYTRTLQPLAAWLLAAWLLTAFLPHIRSWQK